MSNTEIIANRYSQAHVDNLIDNFKAKIMTLEFKLFRLKYKYDKLSISKNNAIDIIHFTHIKAKDWKQKALAAQKTIIEQNKQFNKLLEDHAKLLYELNFLRENYRKIVNHKTPLSLRFRWFCKKIKCKLTKTPFIDWDDKKEPIMWNNAIERLETIIKDKNKEIAILQEAFEYLIADFVEDLVKQGKTYDEIVKERAQFDRVMYWKYNGTPDQGLINL